jgi:uncharacterized protein
LDYAGYLASLLIGLSLGLIGGGGSILTIPVLVYLFGLSPTLAISYSLFIVGFISLLGALDNIRKRLVSFKTVFLFGSSSITTVFLARRFIIPYVPDVFFKIGGFAITHAMFVMVVFGMLMLLAAFSMIRSGEHHDTGTAQTKKKPAILVLYGILIGLVTGFIGAGGGFLLIPALVIMMKLPMRKAVGTSLMIIALNSLIGFLGDIGRHPIDWKLIVEISAFAAAGVFLGGFFNQKVNSRKLKKMFGYFVLLMGVFVLVKEIFLF